MTSSEPTAATPVVVDVDTGLDDAMAIAFLNASPRIDLRAITCVAGNTTVNQVVANTLTVLDIIDAPAIPVAAGARRPLVAPGRHAHAFHGSDGLGDLSLPSAVRAASATPAIELLRDVVERSPEPITLLGLGPLTNLALFTRVFPDHAARLGRVLFMAGAIATGNATPVAEFNAWHDPEALDIVLRSTVPTTMYGLDVFQLPRLPRATVADWASSPRPATRLVAQLLTAFGRHDPGDGEVGIGDAGAACYLAHPEYGVVSRYPTTVALAGAGRGQTIVDRRGRPGEAEEHGEHEPATVIDVVTDIKADAIASAFATTVAREPVGAA